MEVYKIHRALMHITNVVVQQLQNLKQSWGEFLRRLNGYECRVKSSYPVRIDTSITCEVLNGQTPSINCVPVDLEKIESRQEFENFLIDMDTFSFRENHSEGFFDAMLKPREARAFVARHDSRIVGGLWGFFTEREGKEIFHIWLLIIRPEFPVWG